jgi:hypothetical protein
MIEDGCSIISCPECGAINVLERIGNKICPEESLECWCCDNILIDSEVDDENEV